MKFIPCLLAIAFAFCVVSQVWSANLSKIGDIKLSMLDMPFDIQSYGQDYGRVDRNGDGKVDYVVRLDKSGSKSFEGLDFNQDGYLDDFYIYEGGMLVRREIDTNFDRKIDLWMYIYQGQYVEAYERDTNFDGTIDIVKNFDKQAVSQRP